MAKTPLLSLLRRGIAKALGSEDQPKLCAQSFETPLLRKRISRRELTGMATSKSLSLAGLLPLGYAQGCATSLGDFYEKLSGPKTFDTSRMSKIAIIGGGISGLTLAYRLSQHGVPTQIFEGSGRLGGRVFTHRSFNKQDMFIERGGEFIDQEHEGIFQLCKELGVAILPESPPKPLLNPHLFLADGKVYSEEQVTEALKPLAAKILKDQLLLKDADSLSIPTFDHPLSKNPKILALDQTPLAQYLEQSGIDRWARDLMASAYRAEYGLDLEYQSALNILTLVGPHTPGGRLTIAPQTGQNFRIQGGSDTLTSVIAKKIESRVPIYLEHQLIALRDKTTHLELVFNLQGKTRELKAEKVVLSLPPPLLALLDLSEASLDPKTVQCLRNWRMGGSSKIMLGFKHRFWESLGSRGGATLAPLGACWDSSYSQRGSLGILSFMTGGRLGQNTATNLADQCLGSLAQVFPEAPFKEFDGNQDVIPWILHPWSRGSSTCLGPGHYTTLLGGFNKIQLNGKLFFIGEHASIDHPGRMNGAVNSAQRVADTLIRKRRLTRI